MLLRRSFFPTLKRLHEAGKTPANGELAVVYDKNPMEASGYGHACTVCPKQADSVWIGALDLSCLVFGPFFAGQS